MRYAKGKTKQHYVVLVKVGEAIVTSCVSVEADFLSSFFQKSTLFQYLSKEKCLRCNTYQALFQ